MLCSLINSEKLVCARIIMTNMWCNTVYCFFFFIINTFWENTVLKHTYTHLSSCFMCLQGRQQCQWCPSQRTCNPPQEACTNSLQVNRNWMYNQNIQSSRQTDTHTCSCVTVGSTRVILLIHWGSRWEHLKLPGTHFSEPNPVSTST